MVVFTGLAVATVITGGAAAAAGATVGAGMGTVGVGAGTGTALGAAAGSATAAGAIAGSVATGTAAGAGAGAIAGGTAAAGVGASGIGGGALAAGISAGPIGWLCVGTKEGSGGSRVTYDCWKPVLHDNSEELSSGMLLRDLLSHPNIAHVTVTPEAYTDLPHIVLENIWKEKFEIQYLIICANNELVCHANAI